MEALEVFPCGRCGKTFDYINALKRHGKTCNSNKPRKCRKCLQWFENQQSATKHEIQCFNDNTPLSCPFCTKTFDHLYTLQRHYRATHHLKKTKLRKSDPDFGTLIDCTFSPSGEPQHSQNNTNSPSQSVYTIEIESVPDPTLADPNAQKLVYNIREVTNSAETETLPECIISDFEPIEEADNQTDDVIDLEYYEEGNFKTEYIEDDEFRIE